MCAIKCTALKLIAVRIVHCLRCLTYSWVQLTWNLNLIACPIFTSLLWIFYNPKHAATAALLSTLTALFATSTWLYIFYGTKHAYMRELKQNGCKEGKRSLWRKETVFAPIKYKFVHSSINGILTNLIGLRQHAIYSDHFPIPSIKPRFRLKGKCDENVKFSWNFQLHFVAFVLSHYCYTSFLHIISLSCWLYMANIR